MSKQLKIAQPFPRTAIRFQNDFLDFQKGIHVGNLEENQRITRILKLALEARYQQQFVTERFGRGVYWQWIGFLPRSNRSAMPLSSKVSFGCSKFYLTVDMEEQLFKCGFSVERGMIDPPADFQKIRLMPDWDWHRLLAELKPESTLLKELKRLIVREGFRIEVGNWENRIKVTRNMLSEPARVKKILEQAAPASWAGFQVYYAMPEKEIRSSSGVDLIEAMMAIFDEVTPAMNQCMQIRIE
jgi:hypothetical protein